MRYRQSGKTLGAFWHRFQQLCGCCKVNEVPKYLEFCIPFCFYLLRHRQVSELTTGRRSHLRKLLDGGGGGWLCLVFPRSGRCGTPD